MAAKALRAHRASDVNKTDESSHTLDCLNERRGLSAA